MSLNFHDFKKILHIYFFSVGHLTLPETEAEIEDEIRKQESLLADLHLQISSGAASKKTEEQIWEQQRIVTQLKRNLRNAKKGLHSLDTEAEGLKPKYEPIDYEEELDFSLRVPSRNEDTISQASHDLSSQHQPPVASAEVIEDQFQPQQQQQPQPQHDQVDHKVTVSIHQPEEQVIIAFLLQLFDFYCNYCMFLLHLLHFY